MSRYPRVPPPEPPELFLIPNSVLIPMSSYVHIFALLWLLLPLCTLLCPTSLPQDALSHSGPPEPLSLASSWQSQV